MTEWLGQYDYVVEAMMTDQIEEAAEQFEEKMDAAITDLLEELAPVTMTPTRVPLRGWECPKCGNVYAPTVQYCWRCSANREYKWTWPHGQSTGDPLPAPYVVTVNSTSNPSEISGAGDACVTPPGSTCLFGCTS